MLPEDILKNPSENPSCEGGKTFSARRRQQDPPLRHGVPSAIVAERDGPAQGVLPC